MKIFQTSVTLVAALLLTLAVHAQELKKKAFKDARTIRLYVNDSTEDAAIGRFTHFINKTSWTVQSAAQDNGDSNVQSVDTLRTDIGSLFDFMMGEFQGQLEFYADRDDSDKLYIGVSGYASALSWGGSDRKRMKKGGENANWPQRALFKQVNKHLSSYPGVSAVLYSDE